MRPFPAIPLLLLAVAGAAILALQQRQLRRIESRIDTLQQELNGNPAGVPESGIPQENAPAAGVVPDSAILRRLSSLEDSIARLSEANEHLMNRGQLPLSAEKRDQLLARLGDPSLEERDRLQALRVLRRNGALGDDALQVTLAWLDTTTNGGLRSRLLDQLSGLTNRTLQSPLMAMASGDPDPQLRLRAIGALRRFTDDPQVDSRLWETLTQDADPGVRLQARDALVSGSVSEARIASLRDRATGSGSVAERSVAWEALRASGNGSPEVSAALSQLAMSTTDTRDRLRLFEAFNEASDPAFIPPLVQGLQDSSPWVRTRAVDALSDFKSDPAVGEWLRYLAENDADANVRRLAMRLTSDRGRDPSARGRPQNGGPRSRP